jgi:PAS domain S-box-containing protein
MSRDNREGTPSPEELTHAVVHKHENTGVAVVVFDAEGGVTAWNAAAERLFGEHAENLRTGGLVADEWIADIRRCVRRALDGDPAEAEVRQGSERELRVTATPLTGTSGETGGAVVAAEDVSASKRAERELVRGAEKVSLLLEAARYLGETLDPGRVYDRFHELLADSVQHDGVVVSSYDENDGLIRCDYAWVEGKHLNPAILPPLPLNPEGGMQSKVIVTGEPLLANDVAERVKRGGTFYDVDREGTVRKVPETGPPGTRAAMMVPVKHEGRVVGVVQLMSDRNVYTPEQLELVEGLVAQMGAAVRNARLHQAAQAEAAARAHAEAEQRRLEEAESAARALAAERQQAANVLSAVGDGIFLLDRQGAVRLWNRAAEIVTGLPVKRVEGRKITEVLAGWQGLAGRIPIAGTGAAARAVTLPLDIEGNELWLSFVAVRSSDGVVYAFRDVTAERGLEEAKSDFIATVSHELRTPMAGVYGAAQTLLREDIQLTPEQRRAFTEMIGKQSERLTQITGEVLLASRLDRDELPLARVRIDVPELASEAVEAMSAQVPEGIVLELDRRADHDAAYALGDRDRLQQVLVNLLDNAVKYSPDGGTVTVSIERRTDAVRIVVADEGLGIPVGEQERIFEKFYRLDPQLRVGGGTGLGLYISRELVQRMGGRITVRSEPGVGSTFVVELPVAP